MYTCLDVQLSFIFKESKDERIRYGAADSLYSFYMRKEDFEEAEKCLDYFSVQNPQKKQKRANQQHRTK